MTVAGARLSEATCGGATVRVVERVLRSVALIVTGTGELTAVVWTVNVPVVFPAGITMVEEARVATAELLVERWMEEPPLGAAREMVTVPVTELPPATFAGERARLCTASRITAAAWTAPPERPTHAGETEATSAARMDTRRARARDMAPPGPAKTPGVSAAGLDFSGLEF